MFEFNVIVFMMIWVIRMWFPFDFWLICEKWALVDWSWSGKKSCWVPDLICCRNLWLPNLIQPSSPAPCTWLPMCSFNLTQIQSIAKKFGNFLKLRTIRGEMLSFYLFFVSLYEIWPTENLWSMPAGQWSNSWDLQSWSWDRPRAP